MKKAFLYDVDRFVHGHIDLETLKASIDLMLPGDAVNDFLAGMK